MGLDRRSVSSRVLDGEHEPDRALVAIGERGPLPIGASVLGLEVGRHAFDFDRHDFVRAKEDQVDRLTVITNTQLQLGSERRICQRAQSRGELELARVAQGRLPARIRLQHEVEADRIADVTQGREHNSGIAGLDARPRTPCNVGAVGGSLDRPTLGNPCLPDLVCPPTCLRSRTPAQDPGHVPILRWAALSAAYSVLRRGSIC